jgi:hypothetical protein
MALKPVFTLLLPLFLSALSTIAPYVLLLPEGQKIKFSVPSKTQYYFENQTALDVKGKDEVKATPVHD